MQSCHEIALSRFLDQVSKRLSLERHVYHVDGGLVLRIERKRIISRASMTAMKKEKKRP